MTTRISRTKDFTLTLEISNGEFLSAPRDGQRNWILNRVLKEASEQLYYCNSRVSSMVPGQVPVVDYETRREGDPKPEEIMEDWQIPVMEKMSEIVNQGGGSILEIGFGRGISADFIQSYKPTKHTIIECNTAIFNSAEEWKKRQEGQEIRLIEGKWQNVISKLETYDGVLFHTYPMDEDDHLHNVGQSNNFVEHFFETASRLLKPNGHLSYLTLEPDSLDRGHQRSLFNHFGSFTLSKLPDLDIPLHTQDALWIPELVVVDVCK